MNFFEHKDYLDEADFMEHFKLEIPENFNFGFDCVDALAAEEPDRIAAIWANDNEPEKIYTFKEMQLYSDGAARYLRSLGIGKGDRVMLILNRRIHFWFAIVALIKIGAIAIPATHRLTTDDIIYRNQSASVNAIICMDDDKVVQMIEQAQAQSFSVTHLIRIGERFGSYETQYKWKLFDKGILENMDGAPIARTTKNEDPMLLYFTSGTTGYPKMVVHNHTYPLAHIVTAKYWHNLHPGSIHFTLADTGWGKAVWGKLFGQWLCKTTVFIYDHEKLVIQRLMKMLSKYRITSFCAPPTVYKVMLTTNFSHYDLSALEYATSAGEPLNDSVFYDFENRTGIQIYECYGQTETVPVILTSPYTTPRPGSIGKINPLYKAALLDTEGNELTPPCEGELCLKMDPGDFGVFSGYYRNKDMTDFAWRGGYYHTGDLVRMDEEGYVWFTGRTDDIIKSAGYRIGPFEVESIIQQHESVLECAVTGVPDSLRGQIIKASIILREEFKPTEELRKELRAFVKANAASYKIPRIIEFVEELPKTISGKVRRVEMRERDAAKNNAQETLTPSFQEAMS